MKYFKFDETIEAAKAKYHRLSNALHPDKGGTEQEFQEMNADFKDFEAIKRHWDEIKSFFGRSNVPVKIIEKPVIVEKIVYVEKKPEISIPEISGLIGKGADLFKQINKTLKKF